VAAFIASRAPVAEPTAPVDLVEVEFPSVVTETAQGSGVFTSTYYVNPETKRVYVGVMDDEGELKITRPIGYAGMADFKDMVLEDE
jgi:hypothetical protein